MKIWIALAAALLLPGLTGRAAAADDGQFKSLGDFVIKSRVKVVGDKLVTTPIKPLHLTVSTDGEVVRIATEGSTEAPATYKIYRSDGIARESATSGAMEVLPGIQATADRGGVHQHLRMTRESLTLTSFPGVSDQTIIMTAVLVPPAATAKNP